MKTGPLPLGKRVGRVSRRRNPTIFAGSMFPVGLRFANPTYSLRCIRPVKCGKIKFLGE